MIREFRREKGSKIWHFNEDCPDWSTIDCEIWIGVVPPDCEKLCNECYMMKEKQKASYKAKGNKMRNRDISGNEFSHSLKDQVWLKDGSHNSVKIDKCNRIMKYEEYGMETTFGWEIDLIIPKSKGGKDDIENLQPLHWETNREKSDNYPWRCE
jgi:5-methylcytosine-specific restriction endonuclease McrA